ncbi:unnamed protein product [Staurois parvus]
MGSML